MKTTLSGNKRDIYVGWDGYAVIDETQAVNYNKVDMEGVNGLHIYRENDGTYWIAQAGGFTYDRGMFCDLYDREGNKVDVTISDTPLRMHRDYYADTNDYEALIHYDTED